LQTIVSRNLDALDAGVVTIGTIHGGHAHNIIPEAVDMMGTLRSFRAETRELLRRRVREVASSIAAGLGCRAEVEVIESYPATINDPEMTRFTHRVAAEVVGKDRVVSSKAVMGGEDFSYFLQAVPGTFVFLGSNNAARGLTHPHH